MDFKILTKAMAMRIQTCMPSIIHTDQNAFLQHRHIGLNLRTVQDIIDFTNRTSSLAFLLALDYRKAFDSLRWSFILKALRFFGFGEAFCDSIQMLFTDLEMYVFNSGYTTPYFSLSNGVRQGYCVSPLLFVILVEIMALMVRHNTAIEGVVINQTDYKISHTLPISWNH